MAEEDELRSGRPASEFPQATFPTAFVDGVASHVNGEGISKIYFYRVDPNMFGRGGITHNPTFQVVIPTRGFVEMAAFFYQRAKFLINTGVIDEAAWEKALSDVVAAATPQTVSNG